MKPTMWRHVITRGLKCLMLTFIAVLLLLWSTPVTAGPIRSAPGAIHDSHRLIAQVSRPISINFESLPNGTLSGSRQIIPGDSYKDLGVIFSVEGASFDDAVVGIVKNSSTSACIESKSRDNRILGTGRSSFPNGSIGLSGFTIRAHFNPPVSQVSADFQTLYNPEKPMRLRVLSGRNEFGEVTASGTPAGTCGFPGSERTAGEISITMPAGQTITDALFDIPGGGYVFGMDNLTFVPIRAAA